MTWCISIPPGRNISVWVERQAVRCLPAALVVLAFTLPMNRQIRLFDLGMEAARNGVSSNLFIYLSDIPALIAIAAWALTPYWRRLRDLPHWLTALLAALALLATVSALWAPRPFVALYHSVRLWMLLALYLMIAATPQARSAWLWGIVVSGAFQAVIGITQFVHQSSLGLALLGEIIVRPEWSGASVLTVAGQRILRAYGLAQHPNVLGGALAVATLAGTGLVLSWRGWRSGLAIGLTALSLAGLLFSFSRAAWIGLAVAMSVIMLFLWRHQYWARAEAVAWRTLLTLAGVLFTVGLVFVATQWPLLRPRLGLSQEGVEVRSIAERLSLQAGARVLIREHPWLGVGFANFAVALQQRQPEAMAAYPVYQPVHNVPLLMTAELGITGALLWLLLAAGPWAAILARWSSWPPAGVPAGVAISIAASLAALTVIAWFDFYPWVSQPGRLLIYSLFGLWAGTTRARPTEDKKVA